MNNAQNPAVISQADLDALRATLSVTKEGRSFVVRDAEGNILITRSKKAGADQFVQNYLPEFTTIGDTAAIAPTTNQEPIEMTPNETTDLPVIHATLDVTDIVGDTAQAPSQEVEVTKEEVQLSPEEQADFDKRLAKSEKLRAAMAVVLEKVKAGDYKPEETHPSFKTKRSLLVTLEGQDEPSQLPAVLHHRAIASFSEKSMVEGVTLNGKPVNAARTRGTWGGKKTAFLWIESDAIDFPPSMVGSTAKPVVTFHMLLDNYDDFDNLEGASVELDPAMEEAPAPKAKAKADKPTPTDSDEGHVAPAEREHAQA
jgi:hypothetical protein